MKDIMLLTHQTDLSLDEFGKQIMSRRVGQGHPEELTIKVDDHPYPAYGWTDGINSFISIFLMGQACSVKEIIGTIYSLGQVQSS